jgi:ribokinase
LGHADPHIMRSEKPTGAAFICVADNAENVTTVAPGANATLAPQYLAPLENIGWLLLQLETPLHTVIAHATQARCGRLCGAQCRACASTAR